MKIVIMRHGDAVIGADDDAARALTATGRQQRWSLHLLINRLLFS
jgi:phosphohistidine phosphatase SixA